MYWAAWSASPEIVKKFCDLVPDLLLDAVGKNQHARTAAGACGDKGGAFSNNDAYDADYAACAAFIAAKQLNQSAPPRLRVMLVPPPPVPPAAVQAAKVPPPRAAAAKRREDSGQAPAGRSRPEAKRARLVPAPSPAAASPESPSHPDDDDDNDDATAPHGVDDDDESAPLPPAAPAIVPAADLPQRVDDLEASLRLANSGTLAISPEAIVNSKHVLSIQLSAAIEGAKRQLDKLEAAKRKLGEI